MCSHYILFVNVYNQVFCRMVREYRAAFLCKKIESKKF